MGRRATSIHLLGFSVAIRSQQETGTLGQVPTLGCWSSGFRKMHVKFKWIKGVPAGSKQSSETQVDHSLSKDSQLVANCNDLPLF